MLRVPHQDDLAIILAEFIERLEEPLLKFLPDRRGGRRQFRVPELCRQVERRLIAECRAIHGLFTADIAPQRPSRLLPLVAMPEFTKAFSIALPPQPERRAGELLGEILARQGGDGGFLMWPESNQSNPWISGYATWVLDLAAAHGAKVPKAARERAHAYLRRWLVGNHVRTAASLAASVLFIAVLPSLRQG